MKIQKKSAGRWKKNRFFGSSLLIVVVMIFIGLGVYMIGRPKAAPFPTSRDKYEWPFSRYSIWNMPIGSNAQYIPAQMPRFDEFVAETNYNNVDPNAPVKEVRRLEVNSGATTKSWQGHVDQAVVNWVNGTQYISGNKCGSILNAADKNTLIQGQPMDFPGGAAAYYFEWTGDGTVDGWTGDPYTLTGEGRGGCQGGSGLSALGGAIRKGELVGDEPIRHALKIVVFCHRSCSKYENKGYRWPARKADDYWLHGNNSWCPACGDNSYSGPVNDVTMGSLLALHKDEDLSGITDPKAKKVAQALKDYGAYIVDDSATTKYHLSIDALAIADDLGGDSFLSSSGAFQQQMMDLMPKLYVIANNGPNAIGGGGSPRVCYAPPFSNGADEIATNPNGAVVEPSACDDVQPTTNPTTQPTTNPTTQPTISSYDANIDGVPLVGVGDLSVLISNYGKTATVRTQGDLDENGVINVLDLSRLIKHWGQAS